jgi:alkyldihydroxyacetonephosphate synthase
MTAIERRRKWWGWGYDDDGIDPSAYERVRAGVMRSLGDPPRRRVEPVDPDSIALPPPRVTLPPELGAFSTDARMDRITHAYGKAYVDVMRAVRGEIRNPPDCVAYPRDEADLCAMMAFAEAEGFALVPYGGGSSVVGGVEPPAWDGHRGVVTLDLRRLDRILGVDLTSRIADVEGGVFGPALEDGLKPTGLTLRHYPQSFEFSTVGGWIATRASGHFATGPTHIDDLVAGVRLVTPRGVIDTSDLALSGAGPSPASLVLGSEGTLGVITRSWLRVRPTPRHRASTVVHFADEQAGIQAVRALGQSGQDPTNCRLVSRLEAALTGLGDGRAAELLLGFESHDHPVDHDLDRALAICREQGGTSTRKTGNDDLAASRWRSWFLQAPYLRDRLALDGLVVETFETATTWDRLERLNDAVLRTVRDAIGRECGRGIVTWRLNNVYPDGAAPYYTVIAVAEDGREVDQWTAIKHAASDAILDAGGSITHHHAVGKTHRPWYERERGDVFLAALRGLKDAVDPAGIMNPESLLAPRPHSR